ncbi:hypothetical protein Tco_0635073 [Tanacetum coccineum]
MGRSRTACYHYWEEHSEICLEQHRMQIRDPSLTARDWGSHVPYPIIRRKYADLQLNLELLEERRELPSLCEAKYKRQIERYYNSKVRHAQLKVGDFVLRKNKASR